ncbi:hypothetical protein GIR22_15455 [Pseudomonas sp. CCM 7891]|uniref:Uncharacterized protein n=1 Tax=Pseudomonas karstica TaxID=1055468 RepID=A0A7X2RT44_9PSED|nr:hypothetical protein [Pseudomonas karstica]MTD20523.1 hypothetical protein [Pseudomonas karstica]
MRNLDFSSWEGILSTLFGLVLITVVGVGIRLLVMQTIQQRRERENRQINERLRTLIAGYKTLGGSFTGNLEVDPTHLRDLKRRAEETVTNTTEPDPGQEATFAQAFAGPNNGDRSRRVRDAVEAALSDIILLGTEEQVRLAAVAATELVAGRPIHTAELVTSLRDFIRVVLNLEPIPAQLSIPKQGPARPSSSGGSKGESKGAGKGGGSGGDGGGGMGSGPLIESHRDPHH